MDCRRHDRRAEASPLCRLLPHPAYVSVATDYGASLVPESPFVTVVTGRMDEGEMETFLREHAISQVIDATHPYATAVTANIRQACAAVGVPYRRIQRRRGRYEDQSGCIAVHSVGEAVEVLSHTTGPIFLTTGSKDLDSFAQIPDYASASTPASCPSGRRWTGPWI